MMGSIRAPLFDSMKWVQLQELGNSSVQHSLSSASGDYGAVCQSLPWEEG
jgi:hypothetical protein